MSVSYALQRCSQLSGGRQVSGPPPAASAAARSHKLGRLQSKLQVSSIPSVPTGIVQLRGGEGPAGFFLRPPDWLPQGGWRHQSAELHAM
jgi:hypothetical protein